jgi:hypothetical protein
MWPTGEFHFAGGEVRFNRQPFTGTRILRLKSGFGISARWAAVLLLGAGLAACVSDDEGSKSISYTSDRGVTDQPYPTDYRPEALAFLKTYINNPVGVHNAVIAEPVQRTVGGRLRYVTCLRYSARDFDGNYRDAREHAIVYVDTRLDRMIDKPGDICAGAVYAAFPELEKLTR